MCCLFSKVLKGKNLKDGEFQALSDMLSSAQWELPAAQEYKNDLVQPSFLAAVEGVPKASSQKLIPLAAPKPDPEGPATDDQWKNVLKMVA